MGQWPRDEIESAFRDYSQAVIEIAETGNWASYADQFTEDARYVEHEYGTYEGREAIREWIVATMATVSGMSFPIEWYVIDGNRVIMYCWNVFDPLPGMSGEYKFAVATILEYAGNGQWSLEEDIYNEKEAEQVIARFVTDATAAGHQVPGGPPA